MHPYPNELLLYKGKSLCPVAKLLVYMGMGMALLKQRMGVGQGYIYAKILKMKIKIKHNNFFCKSTMIDLKLNSSLIIQTIQTS